MNYKIEGALKRNRKNFIIFGVLWLLIAVVLVSAWAHSTYIANANGNFNIAIGLQGFDTVSDDSGSYQKDQS